MGSESQKKKERSISSGDSSSCEEEEGRSRKRHRKRPGSSSEEEEKPRKRSSSSRSSKEKHHRKHSKDNKSKHKKSKHRHLSKMGIKELSEDDYFSKNNEFATWLKEERNIFFSDLSSQSARDLFSDFIKDWNDLKLETRYYEGISTGPRSAHNWNIKR